MKRLLWLWQVPIVALCVFAFTICDLGARGQLESEWLRDGLFPSLRKVSTTFSDLKFKLRGPKAPRNKIVIVDVDSASIDALGRWPWHRDVEAAVVDTIFSYGARAVGLDMVLSESDRRVPEELSAEMSPESYAALRQKLETDPKFTEVVRRYSDRLVLGWMADPFCQPLYAKNAATECPVNDPQVLQSIPAGYDKFAFSVQQPLTFDPTKTPVLSVLTMLPNLPEYNEVASHAGHINVVPDPDGMVRRTNLVFAAGARIYPSLPLEMARVGLGERLTVALDASNRIRSLGFEASGQQRGQDNGRMLPVSPVGAVEINFRGPRGSFPYVSVAELLGESERLQDDGGRRLASLSKRDIFKDAYVILGVSAVGVYDMRAFPFDSNVPGVEGHATILDNILSNDFMTSGTGWWSSSWLYLIMSLGGILFAIAVERLDAIPALLFTLLVFAGFGAFDLKLLFARNIDWNTSFLVIELSSIFIFTIAAKYVLEERNKRFIRGAFAKYVAPAVVDAILKDPKKLTVGGEKRDLTILFSDIRGFTTFSEKMDAKALAAFLNDYLSIQTETIFGNEGTLDKYIGDAIMAFWGAPLDQPMHAANACRTAVQMIRSLSENRARYKEEYGVDVDVGIGLNSGVVSVGNMGSNENFAYTVIGDHVNLASRLEGLTKYYGASIITSRFTLNEIEASGESPPSHRVLDLVKVKGKKNAVELIQLLERDYSAAGLACFEEARQLYLARRWDEAAAKFREANEMIGASLRGSGASGSPATDGIDGPCRMYLERIEALRKDPPGADWDGSWEMQSK